MEFPLPVRIKSIIERKKKDAEMLLFTRCFSELANFRPPVVFPRDGRFVLDW